MHPAAAACPQCGTPAAPPARCSRTCSVSVVAGGAGVETGCVSRPMINQPEQQAPTICVQCFASHTPNQCTLKTTASTRLEQVPRGAQARNSSPEAKHCFAHAGKHMHGPSPLLEQVPCGLAQHPKVVPVLQVLLQVRHPRLLLRSQVRGRLQRMRGESRSGCMSEQAARSSLTHSRKFRFRCRMVQLLNPPPAAPAGLQLPMGPLAPCNNNAWSPRPQVTHEPTASR